MLTYETTSGAWSIGPDTQKPSYMLLPQPVQHVTTTYKREYHRLAENFLTGSGLKLSNDKTSTIRDLRNISGLTWELLAKLLGVSRRTLHSWDNGHPMAVKNEDKLGRIMKAIKSLGKENVAKNRRLLLSTTNGQIPFDLLKEERFDEFDEIKDDLISINSTKKPTLSHSEVMERLPLPPQDIVEAKFDPADRNIQKKRKIKIRRVKGHDEF